MSDVAIRVAKRSKLEDLEVLQAVQDGIDTVATPYELRRIYQQILPANNSD